MKKATRKRAPGGGRKPAYGEPTTPMAVRLPARIVRLLDLMGPSRNAALVAIVRGSVQYRLEYGADPPSVE